MLIVIVATCETSKGLIDVGVYAADGRMTGTRDSEALEFSDYEAGNLIAQGKARLPLPAPVVIVAADEPAEASAAEAAPTVESFGTQES